MFVKRGYTITHYTWHCLRWSNWGLISRSKPQVVGNEHKAIIYKGNKQAFEDDLKAGLVEAVSMTRKNKDDARGDTAERWVKRTEKTYNISNPEDATALKDEGVQFGCPASFIPDV